MAAGRARAEVTDCEIIADPDDIDIPRTFWGKLITVLVGLWAIALFGVWLAIIAVPLLGIQLNFVDSKILQARDGRRRRRRRRRRDAVAATTSPRRRRRSPLAVVAVRRRFAAVLVASFRLGGGGLFISSSSPLPPAPRAGVASSSSCCVVDGV